MDVPCCQSAVDELSMPFGWMLFASKYVLLDISNGTLGTFVNGVCLGYGTRELHCFFVCNKWIYIDQAPWTLMHSCELMCHLTCCGAVASGQPASYLSCHIRRACTQM